MFVAGAQSMGGGDNPNLQKRKVLEQAHKAKGRSVCEKREIRTRSKECKCSSHLIQLHTKPSFGLTNIL